MEEKVAWGWRPGLEPTSLVLCGMALVKCVGPHLLRDAGQLSSPSASGGELSWAEVEAHSKCSFPPLSLPLGVLWVRCWAGSDPSLGGN